jgi:hypothetical protein
MKLIEVSLHFIRGDIHPVRLNLSARLISHDTMFFSHNKTTLADLSVTEFSLTTKQHQPTYQPQKSSSEHDDY